MRSAASTSVILMSFSGSMRSSPYDTTRARRLVQLRGQLDARCPGADDHHAQLFRPQRLALRVGADAGVDEAAMEACRPATAVSSAIACSLHARRAEIVGQTADRDDQRVVAKLARDRDHVAAVIHVRRDLDHATARSSPTICPAR